VIGLIISVPITIAAIITLAIARPPLRWNVGFVVVGAVAFALGFRQTDEDTEQSANNIAAEMATNASALAVAGPMTAPTPGPATPFTLTERASAKAIDLGGDVAVDAFDVRADGARIISGLKIPADQTLHVSGWAYVASMSAPCDAVGLLVDGKQIIAGRYGFPRPDVSATYSSKARLDVGYVIDVPGSVLGSGNHVARVICVRGDTGREDDVLLRFSVR
jgi:hypothetical protein